MAEGQLPDQQLSQSSPRSEPVTARQLEEDQASQFQRMEEEAKRLEKIGRECPVPKPGGIIGQVLGFNADKDREQIWDGASKTVSSGSKNAE